MSEALTIATDEGEGFTRQPRRERAQRTREVSDDPVEIIASGDTMSPEVALADSRQQLQSKDREVAEARRVAREATQREQAAQAEVARARESQVVDRQAVVAQAIETAKAEQSSARQALKTAQETGDADAMADAVEALSGASTRFNQATGELAWLKTQPKSAATPQQNQHTPTPAAQKWLDEHPRYHSDEAYRSTAEGAHNAALRAGKAAGSDAYIQHIDQIMERVYGAGHGQSDDGMTQPEEARPMNNQQRRPAPSAVPPSRNSGGSGGGWKTIKTELGDLLVQDRPDGTRGVRFPNAKVESDFKEGAMLDKRASHSPEAFKKALAEYTNDHIKIAEEIAEGGTGDLIRGDGRTYGRDD